MNQAAGRLPEAVVQEQAAKPEPQGAQPVGEKVVCKRQWREPFNRWCCAMQSHQTQPQATAAAAAATGSSIGSAEQEAPAAPASEAPAASPSPVTAVTAPAPRRQAHIRLPTDRRTASASSPCKRSQATPTLPPILLHTALTCPLWKPCALQSATPRQHPGCLASGAQGQLSQHEAGVGCTQWALLASQA
jgi:hypothetical protein